MVFGTTILGSNPSAPAINIMSLINNIRKFFFPFYKERKIKEIFEILNKDKKDNAMLVGGCVRNFLNNQEINDVDIATIFTPSEVIKKFSKTPFRVIKTGVDHGTVTLIKEGKNFEVTTLREDISTDGRHAKVSFTKEWKKDSERRDFTINAIYLDQYGKIFDPQNGLLDLKNKTVKFIGDPEERIQEDYLRILRFLRFSLQYNNKNQDQETLKIIKKNLDGISKLSKERIFGEIIKILSLNNFRDIFLNDNLYEIFKVVFSEFKYLDRLKDINNEIYNNFLKSDQHLLLALLLVDEKDNHAYFSHKYKVSNYLRENLEFYHKYFYEAKKDKNFFQKNLKKNLFYHGKRKITSLAKFYFIQKYKKNYVQLSNTLKIISSISVPQFPITGKYLLERGFASGKHIGEVLNKIEKIWIEKDFNLNNEELKTLIKKYN